MADEVTNNLPFAVLLAHLEGNPDAVKPYFASVASHGEIVAAAARNPPRRVLLSAGDPEAVYAIARDCFKVYQEDVFPGVNGPVANAERFAEAWRELTGERFELRRKLRWYRLDVPPDSSKVPGRLRIADKQDRDVLVTWVVRQIDDSPASNGERVGRLLVDAGIRRHQFFLWDHGGPVSMAMVSRSTPNGSCISMVYTPTRNRRRGYAGACVGEVSRRLLSDGRRFSFLSVDLRDPAAMRIYTKLGFRSVSDSAEIDFLDP